LLLHSRQQQRVKIGLFLLDLAGQGAEVRFPPSGAAPSDSSARHGTQNYQCDRQAGQFVDGNQPQRGQRRSGPTDGRLTAESQTAMPICHRL
jgi:hypothetical protein